MLHLAALSGKPSGIDLSIEENCIAYRIDLTGVHSKFEDKNETSRNHSLCQTFSLTKISIR